MQRACIRSSDVCILRELSFSVAFWLFSWLFSCLRVRILLRGGGRNRVFTFTWGGLAKNNCKHARIVVHRKEGGRKWEPRLTPGGRIISCRYSPLMFYFLQRQHLPCAERRNLPSSPLRFTPARGKYTVKKEGERAQTTQRWARRREKFFFLQISPPLRLSLFPPVLNLLKERGSRQSTFAVKQKEKNTHSKILYTSLASEFLIL